MPNGVQTAASVGVAVAVVLGALRGGVASAQPVPPPADDGNTVVIEPKPGTLRRSLRFQIIDRSKGLPQNGVQAVVQDKVGFMWLGTGDGLARWDGQRFLTFRHDPADPTSLGASYVNELLLAKDGTLWVGTVGGGVNRYRPDRSAFDRFAAKPGQPESLQSGSILAMSEGPDGRIWIGTNGGGLSVLDPTTGKVRTWSTEDALDPVVGAVRVTQDGVVWAGTSSGVFRVDSKTGKVDPFLPDSEELSGAIITAITTDAKGDLWIGTEKNGLARYNPATKKLTWYTADPANPQRLTDNSIRSIYQDRSGRIWVGGNLILYILDPASGRFERHPAEPADLRALPDTPLDVYQDAAGVIWVGTFGGGAALLESSGFSTFKTTATISAFFPKGKDVWVTTAEGACRWRGDFAFEGVCYRIPGAIPVLVDREGTVWVGTENEGLFRLDQGAGNRWVRYQNDPKDKTSLALGSVTRLYEDRKGTLWVAQFGGGLQRFDRKRNYFVSIELPTTDLYMVKEDPKRDGVLWLGTAGRGLVSIDVGSADGVGEMVEFIPRKDDLENKTDNSIADFLFDGDRTVWLASYGGGLKRLDRSNGQIKTYRRAEGIPNDVVYAIERDASGKLWVSTLDGLIQFDPKTEKAVVFTMADGLQSDEYTLGAGDVTDDGRMIFGGLKGFDVFRPADVRAETYRPPMVVTSIQILGEPLKTDRPVSSIHSLSLAHDEAFVAVEFAALSFSGSDQFQFEYMVEGASDRWLRSQAGIVNLAGLDDGDYRLLLRARNRHGVQSEPIALSLTVAPPLWRSWYALAAYGAILLGIIAGVYRYQRVRIERLRKLARLATVEREFEVTAAVQSWFLPESAMYSTGGCDLVGFYRGAEKCSGDWWWYENVGQDKLWVIVADVTGHGPGPAMLTAAVAMGLWVQSEPATSGEVVGRLSRVNREVLARCKGKATMTMTAILLDLLTGECMIYSLGGLPALLLERQGKHTVIGASGTPIGSVPNLEIGERTTRMNPGDRLIITTDGIVETTLEGGRPLGFRRFVNVLREVRGMPLGQAVQRIVNDVDVARATQPQEDDFTFCMLERR